MQKMRIKFKRSLRSCLRRSRILSTLFCNRAPGNELWCRRSKKYRTSRTAHSGPASIGHIPHSRRTGKVKPARQGRQSAHQAAVRLYPFLFNSSGNTAVSARTFRSMVSSVCCLNRSKFDPGAVQSGTPGKAGGLFL